MTASSTKPIIQFGQYQITHRNEDEYNHLKQATNNKPFLLFLLSIPANIGIMVTLLKFFEQLLKNISVPLAVVFALFFLSFYLSTNNISSFLLKFKFINTKKHTTTHDNSKSFFGVVDWIVVFILSVLGSLLFYFYVYGKLPENSYEINILRLSILILTISHYIYSKIKILLR